MRGFTRAHGLCVALVGFLIGADAGSLIVAKDRLIASKAIIQASSLCQGLGELSLPDDPKGKLTKASGNNFALESMRGAKDMDEFNTRLNDKITPGFVLSKAGPIMACLLFFIAYLLCCWTSCPCCACCRIRRKEHSPKRIFKLVVFIVIGFVLFGMLIAGIMSQRGFNRAADGFKHTSCTGAGLLNTTLNGNAEPHFLGMIPALGILDELVQVLNPTSQFITDLNKVLAETKPIEDAVYITKSTLTLLRDMVALPANKKPKTAAVGIVAAKDLLHECVLCDELSKALTPAIKALNEGMASKLNEARAEVKKQLSGTALTDLQKTVQTATTPLGDIKTLFVDTFGWMVDSTTLQDLTGHMDKAGLYFCLVLVLCALLISCCASTTLTFWTCREKRGVEPNHQYRATVHRLACVTWCSGCCYMFLAFLIGGIMTVISVPMASMCMIMDDVNGKMLDDISGALSMNLSGDSGVMMKDMIDQCFRNPDKSANPFLLDIIFTRNATSQQKVSLRKSIVNNTKDMIDNQFNEISKSMGQPGSASMATDPKIVSLGKTLRDTKISSLMLIPTTYDFQNSPYKNMLADAATAADPKTGLGKYLVGTSGDCADFVQGTNTINGVTSFSKYLAKDFGTVAVPLISAPSCAQKVVCKTQPVTPAGIAQTQACAAANDFMQLKQDLRAAKTFTCRWFKDKNGNKCDIMNMVRTVGGTYTGDCVHSNGITTLHEEPCTLDEFSTLVQDFDKRINVVFTRLDKSASDALTKINVQMKSLVTKDVTSRISTFADGVTCGFLGNSYQKFIESACYAGVVGFTQVSFAYVACGVLTLLLVIIMYIVWRIAVDNYNTNKDRQQGPGGAVP